MTNVLDKPDLGINEEKNSVTDYVDAFLSFPEQKVTKENTEFAKKLGHFLLDNGYIESVKLFKDSWAFKYQSDEKSIYISEIEMPAESYEYFVFRLGKDPESGSALYPACGGESDMYRFFHEVGHAYQDYLTDKERIKSEPGGWYDQAAQGKINSPYGVMFQYCYKKRAQDPSFGLSTWGSGAYGEIKDVRNQAAARAMEDVNELVEMYLWNPNYLNTYLDYLSKNIPGYENELQKDRLVSISANEKEALKEIVKDYVDVMRRDIGV